MGRRLIILLGPTAVGKTDYSLELAEQYGSPIISCDSRQIYKEMSIGTAVPTREQLERVHHYFIHSHSITGLYTAGMYEADALNLIHSLFKQGHETLIMTGGSMFYIDAVCNGIADVPKGDPIIREALWKRKEDEGLEALAAELREADPQTWDRIDRNNPQRVIRALEVFKCSGKPLSSFRLDSAKERDFEIEKIGLRRSREDLYSRIDRRVISMMDEGLLNEVRSLNEFRNLTAMQTVGYKELFCHLDDPESFPLDEAVSKIQQHTRNYAKRQMTWWRSDSAIRWKDL